MQIQDGTTERKDSKVDPNARENEIKKLKKHECYIYTVYAVIACALIALYAY